MSEEPNKRLRELAEDHKPKGLVSPLTEQSPTTEFEAWVASQVKNRDTWLNEVNKPLKDLGPFTEKEIFGNYPYLLGETRKPIKVGTGTFVAETKFKNVEVPDVLNASYRYLTHTDKYMEEKGGLCIVFADKDENVPEGEIKGKVKIDKGTLDKLNADLAMILGNESDEKEFGNSLPENLIQTEGENVSVVESYEITSGLGYFAIVTLNLDSGDQVPILYNFKGANTHGSVYLIKDTAGNIRILQNTRVVPPLKETGNKVELEAPRKFATYGQDKSFTPSREMDYKPEDYSIIDEITVQQNLETDAVPVDLVYIEVDKELGAGHPPNQLQHIDYHFLPPEELIDLITQGEIRDVYTIYAAATFLLNEGFLKVDKKKIGSKTLLCEEKFFPQLGKSQLVVPRGPESLGTQIGNERVLPDSGKHRAAYPVNEVTLSEYLKATKGSPKLVKVPILEGENPVINMLKKGKFSTVDAAAIIKGLLKEGILIY